MNAVKIVAIALIYGGFTYTKKTDQLKLGPIELTIKGREMVNIPVWAGVAGAALLFVRK